MRTFSEISRDFDRHFNYPISYLACRKILAQSEHFYLDIELFDKFLYRRHIDQDLKGLSTADIVRRLYGEEAYNLILEILPNVYEITLKGVDKDYQKDLIETKKKKGKKREKETPLDAPKSDTQSIEMLDLFAD